MSETIGRSTWVGAAIAAAALIAVIAVVIGLWMQVGDSDITAAGWAAMILGIVLTLAVGIGLMALVFISNRGGYDDRGSGG
jgi:hypothetical protein